jgi:hypothetical protein
MDWANEEYVRVYTRETSDDLELSWQAVALWRAMLCKFDRAGLLEAKNGWVSVAKVVRMPEDVVIAAGKELERDGRVIRTKRGMFAPNFTEAQTVRKSDKARQRESRDRRREEAAKTAGTDETPQTAVQVLESTEPCHTASPTSHTMSHDVTLRSALPPDSAALPPVALSLLPVTASPDPSPKRTRGKSPKVPPPEGWKPRRAECDFALSLGLDADLQAQKFLNNAIAKGNRYADWNMAFHNWLDRALDFAPRRAPGKSPIELQRERIAMLQREEQDALEKADLS